jgi:rRNA maturation endonuclease Nob1
VHHPFYVLMTFAEIVSSTMASPDEKYYAIVVDSGAIIKHAGFQTLHNAGNLYFSPPGVLEEIRDKQARQHLDALPFHLHIREPTSEGLKKVIEFSKKTGDYASLSVVDLHVLALLYDLGKKRQHNYESFNFDFYKPHGYHFPIEQKRKGVKAMSSIYDMSHSLLEDPRKGRQVVTMDQWLLLTETTDEMTRQTQNWIIRTIMCQYLWLKTRKLMRRKRRRRRVIKI